MYSFIMSFKSREGGWGRGSAGSEPLECVEARRAAAASVLALTVTALSLLFRDVLSLLQLRLMCTFLSKRECGNVMGGVRPELRAVSSREISYVFLDSVI